MRTPRFIDNGNAPEFFTSGLHAVEVLGSNSRFICYVEKRTDEGEIVHEAIFSFIVPNEAIGPAVGLTLQTLGPMIVVPAIGEAVHMMLRH